MAAKPGCCSPPASPRCTRPARSRPSCAWRRPASTRSTSWCSGGAAHDRLDPDDPGQRGPVQGATTWSRTLRRLGPLTPGLYDVAIPGQHEPALRCRGAAPRTRSGSSATRGWPTSRSWAGCSTAPLMLGVPQIVAAAVEQTRAAAGQREAARADDGGQRDEPDAAAGEHRGSTSPWTRCTPRDRWAARTASSTAIPTTSRPACCRPTARTRCSSSRPRRAGFASGCQAFGHRELLGVLRSFGLVMEPNLTVYADGPGATKRVRLADYLDKGARLRPGGPCLTDGRRSCPTPTCSGCRWRIARALDRLRRPAGRQGRDLVGERPDRFQLRVRHLAGRARCGARSTRATRRRRTVSYSTLRLPGPALPGRLRVAGRPDPARPPAVTTFVCLDGAAAAPWPVGVHRTRPAPTPSSMCQRTTTWR